MVLASGAEDIGSDVAGAATGGTSGASGAPASSGRKFGLTGGQRAAAAGRLLPRPRTSHPYIVGLSLVAVGLLALVGSITGQLPSMVAALFVPSALGPSPTSDIILPLIGPDVLPYAGGNPTPLDPGGSGIELPSGLGFEG